MREESRLAAMLVPRPEWARFGDVFENPNSRKLFKSRIFEEGDKCQQCAAAKPVRTLAGLNQLRARQNFSA